MGFQCQAAFSVVLWAGHLFVLSAAYQTTSPRIITAPLGEKRFLFDTTDDHAVLYHEEGTSFVLVGGVEKLYYHDFQTSASLEEPFPSDVPSKCRNPEDEKNYLTLLEKSGDSVMICGTNNCSPTCWNWQVNQQKSSGTDGRGLAPFVRTTSKSLVLIDGDSVFSTIKRRVHNSNVPRFRRIRGISQLYSSDSLMQHPDFVKGAFIKQDEAYNEKIYLFFQEDNPEWMRNSAASKTIPRVAQLCKGDRGGNGSLSGAKWSTFLKSTLLCDDSATDRRFSRLQDIFIVESDDWQQTKVYGLFLNEWDYSAVCVFSVGDIAKIFQTSPLKGYNERLPAIRPGQCLEDVTPIDTFRVIDSYPEVTHKVKHQSMVFYSKHHYQKLGVHQVLAADGVTYNVFYLATDKGTIHKIVALKKGVMNIMEIQPFQHPAVVNSMILDNTTNALFVASTAEVVRLPLAMCDIYKDNCGSCVLARDPYCGWSDGKCISVYTHNELGWSEGKCTSDYTPNQHGNGALLQALTHDVSPDVCASESQSSTKEDSNEHLEKITVAPLSRYYLNCSIESHHANYTWFLNKQSIAHCEGGHHHCIHFIDNMTAERYGIYSCVSQEDWFSQTLLTQQLMKPDTMAFRSITELPYNWATAPSLSMWLGLCMGAVFLLIL